MKIISLFILLISILIQIQTSQNISDKNVDQNITNKITNDTTIQDNSTLNNTSEKKKKRKKRRKPRVEQPQYIPETSGVHINDTVFDEKLKRVIEERNLKPNKKITKEQLKSIFVYIYKKEEDPEKKRRFKDEDNELTPEEQSEKFMDTLFNKVAKGLDWDDKIKVKDIKEWIPPEKTKEAYNEMLYSLAEEMGYL